MAITTQLIQYHNSQPNFKFHGSIYENPSCANSSPDANGNSRGNSSRCCQEPELCKMLDKEVQVLL